MANNLKRKSIITIWAALNADHENLRTARVVSCDRGAAATAATAP